MSKYPPHLHHSHYRHVEPGTAEADSLVLAMDRIAKELSAKANAADVFQTISGMFASPVLLQMVRQAVSDGINDFDMESLVESILLGLDMSSPIAQGVEAYINGPNFPNQLAGLIALELGNMDLSGPVGSEVTTYMGGQTFLNELAGIVEDAVREELENSMTIYKPTALAAGKVTTTPTTIYTPPAEGAVVTQVVISNYSASSTDVTLTWWDGSAYVRLLGDTPITANSTYILDINLPLAGVTSVLRVEGGNNSALEYTITGLIEEN